ncbi:MAG: PP0621 family protein [Burkholderiales bacterium]|jgi:uncharacterized protein
MTRLVLVLLLLLVVVLWWKSRKRGGSTQAPPADQSQHDAQAPETMVRCAQCGVHLPASQSLPGLGGVFCSAAHREQFESKP